MCTPAKGTKEGAGFSAEAVMRATSDGDRGGGQQHDDDDRSVGSDPDSARITFEQALHSKSMREALGLEFKPTPPEPDPWDADIFRRCKCLHWFVKTARPMQVKEVEPKHQRKALAIFYLLLGGFVLYIFYQLRQSLLARRSPVTKYSVINQTWTMPNLVVCDDRVHNIHHALHSGWSMGYPDLPEKEMFRKKVQVLDASCSHYEGCFWLEFKGLTPGDVDGMVTNKQLVMDLLYAPVYNTLFVNKDIPNAYSAHVSFTDEDVDTWCTGTVRPQGSFPIAVSRMDNQTSRSFIFLQRQLNDSLDTSQSLISPKRERKNYYSNSAATIPVTNYPSSLINFTWFSSCTRTQLRAGISCGTDVATSIDLEWTKRNWQNRTQALLLNFVQEDYTLVFEQADPFDWLTLLGNIGGFWAYVSGAFSLLFIISETTGKRRPHDLIRFKKWKRIARRMTRTVSALPLVCQPPPKSWRKCDGTGSTADSGSGPTDHPPPRESLRQRQAGPCQSFLESEGQMSTEERLELVERVLQDIIEAPLLWDKRMLAELYRRTPERRQREDDRETEESKDATASVDGHAWDVHGHGATRGPTMVSPPTGEGSSRGFERKKVGAHERSVDAHGVESGGGDESPFEDEEGSVGAVPRHRRRWSLTELLKGRDR